MLRADGCRESRYETLCSCAAAAVSGKPSDITTTSNSCHCGEDQTFTAYEWGWDRDKHSCATLTPEYGKREVIFHHRWSNGTAAVRGDTPLYPHNQYYWELKMITPVYGTDIMIGVCTSEMEIKKKRLQFVSLVGEDRNSWGLSYNGSIQHNGVKTNYGPAFGQGSIVGVHLDLWLGVLSFYINRKPQGVAFTGLRDRVLYPVACSTAARSGMKLIYTKTYSSSLQFLSIRCLHDNTSLNKETIINNNFPPGIKHLLINSFWWFNNAKGTYDKSVQTNNSPELVLCTTSCTYRSKFTATQKTAGKVTVTTCNTTQKTPIVSTREDCSSRVNRELCWEGAELVAGPSWLIENSSDESSADEWTNQSEQSIEDATDTSVHTRKRLTRSKLLPKKSNKHKKP